MEVKLITNLPPSILLVVIIALYRQKAQACNPHGNTTIRKPAHKLRGDKYMNTTEKIYWSNGYQIRGGWFKTLALSFANIGILFCWGNKPQKQGFYKSLQFYKLI
jgi:hypothetical protein